MHRTTLLAATLTASAGLAVLVASLATAQTSRDPQPDQNQEMQLPPGWTMQDMQAMMAAGTPGKEHQRLLQDVGEWHGSTTMWMGPDGDALTSDDAVMTITPVMDGHYIRCQMKGAIPGMGPYSGEGIYGYDNVAQQYVSTWIDNHSTGILIGTGEASPDGKTITRVYTYHCPINKKPTHLREVETMNGPNRKTLEMYGPDPKTGEVYKMMRIELEKPAGAGNSDRDHGDHDHGDGHKH